MPMLLIHLIGKVGAGKTTFRAKKWPAAPCFDIKDVYRQFHFTPEQLKLPENYARFESALDSTLNNFVRQCEADGEKFAVVESSGINQALNRLLGKYAVRRVLIESEYADWAEQNRSYAYGLNRRFEQLCQEGKVRYDRRIYTGDY